MERRLWRAGRTRMQLHKHALTACALVGVGAAACDLRTQAAAPRVAYKVTDLGTLPACDVTYATGVNSDGWVSGYAYKHVPPGHGNSLLSRPFLWRDGKLTELPRLGGDYGQALAIDARGNVAGYAEAVDSSERPVMWRRRDGFAATPLSELSGRVMCLLREGTGCGYVYQSERNRAAVWWDGKLQIVGDPDDAETLCHAVNAHGTAVGERVPRGGQTQSIRRPGDWRAVMWKGGRQADLPSLLVEGAPGSSFSRPASVCEAINQAGVAVGWSDSAAGRQACLWRNGKLEVLPAPAGFTAQVRSLNNSRVMVGEAMERANKPGWKRIACRWVGNKVEDLNNLIPADSGWKLSVAAHISDNGLIVGYGSYNRFPTHDRRAYLLTPLQR